MKHIKVYENFVNESKAVNEASKKNDHLVAKELAKLAKMDTDRADNAVQSFLKNAQLNQMREYWGAASDKAAAGVVKKHWLDESLDTVNESAFDMYTPAGDKACQKLVDGIVAKINGDKKMTGEEVEKLLKDGVAKVAKTHREVHDTEPRGEIAHQISKALKAAGYAFYFDSYGHLNESTFSVEDGIKVQSSQLAQWKQLLQPKVYKDIEKWATEHNDKAESGNQIVRGTDMDNFIGNYFNSYTPSNKR
jgi:hypothetical protein